MKVYYDIDTGDIMAVREDLVTLNLVKAVDGENEGELKNVQIQIDVIDVSYDFTKNYQVNLETKQLIEIPVI